MPVWNENLASLVWIKDCSSWGVWWSNVGLYTLFHAAMWVTPCAKLQTVCLICSKIKPIWHRHYIWSVLSLVFFVFTFLSQLSHMTDETCSHCMFHTVFFVWIWISWSVFVFEILLLISYLWHVVLSWLCIHGSWTVCTSQTVLLRRVSGLLWQGDCTGATEASQQSWKSVLRHITKKKSFKTTGNMSLRNVLL